MMVQGKMLFAMGDVSITYELINWIKLIKP